MTILVLDNHDSFTYNLVQQLGRLGADLQVRTNDALDLDGVREMDPDGIVISPGPGHPANDRDFGVCGPVLEEVSPETPTLGVCLGMQGFVLRYGGSIRTSDGVVHGKSTPVRHDGDALLAGVPDPFEGGRYHSLVVDELPDAIERTAWTDAGEIMAVRHREHPIVGVQFHPESVLTDHGDLVVGNFLEMTR